VPRPEKIERATLTAFNLERNEAIPDNNNPEVFEVQFNPQSLKTNYSSRVEGGNQSGGSGTQFTGTIESKMSVELWFDITAPLRQNEGVKDVVELLKKVRRFVEPRTDEERAAGQSVITPGVRFQWGNFIYDGVVEAVDETIEFFSEDGVPLRASVSFSIKEKLIAAEHKKRGGAFGAGIALPKELPQISPGDSIQQAAAELGNLSNWQKIAQANGIENPRFPPAGMRLNMSFKL